MKTIRIFVQDRLAKIYEGESCIDIIKYALPELISSMILLTLPPLIDSYIISNSQTMNSYGALAMAVNFLYTLTKFAESIPVAAMAVIGRYNGAKEYEKCGEALGSTFWLTILLGALQFVIIFISATAIYRWLNVPEEMVLVGAPFLRLKSLGIFLIFTLLGFVGFMRGIKNTTMPMYINIAGIITFIFFDIALVLGKWGFPTLSLHGSALATILQYAVMNAIAVCYILFNPTYNKYFKRVFFTLCNYSQIIKIANLSWPIIIDKTSFALSYVWLAKMIAGMGTYAIATYDVVKNLERFAFLPAMALAQVVTFLVSNRLGSNDPDGASANIKKILFLTATSVGLCLLAMSLNASYLVSFFDPRGNFTAFAATVFPLISMFVIFDLIQVVLAGALRGAGDVQAVMWTRFLVTIFLFFPMAYGVNLLPIDNVVVKFSLLYSTYYISNGIMAFIFLHRALSHKWQKTKI
ncbi:MATE family efflux transporter [Candidatus Dependentiae bacterium]|nr:MATE family efflux transporter [Candidatus Dependentiae bacterium]